MQGTRLQKIQRLVQKELSEIFREETAKTHGVLVSVSNVRVTPDLSIARAYLSIFPSERGKEIIDNVNKNAAQIRYNLAARVRYQLRRTPELAFYLDDSLDYIAHIDDLLREDEEKMRASRPATSPASEASPAAGGEASEANNDKE